MAGRGSFQAIKSGDVDRFLGLSPVDRFEFAGDERAAVFVAEMDKAWVAIHCALSDGTLFGALGEPPLTDAVLGDHLVCQLPTVNFVYLKYPREVTDIAQELSKLSREGFEEKLAEVVADEDMESLGYSLWHNEIECVWPYFEQMRAFYQRAGTEGLAVLFHWGG
jgi:hypothetical protein